MTTQILIILAVMVAAYVAAKASKLPVETGIFAAAFTALLARISDANEVAQAWRVHLDGDGPTAIVLTRQKVALIDRSTRGTASGLAKGGYVLDAQTIEKRGVFPGPGRGPDRDELGPGLHPGGPGGRIPPRPFRLAVSVSGPGLFGAGGPGHGPGVLPEKRRDRRGPGQRGARQPPAGPHREL